jgi:hypothetical protein
MRWKKFKGITVAAYCMPAVDSSPVSPLVYDDSSFALRSGNVEDTSIDDGPEELWGSRICGTYFKYGGCSGAGRSKSCSGTLICIPL